MQCCFLLDVAAFDAYAVAGLGMLLLFLLACVLTEAGIVWLLNKPAFKKAFYTSLWTNLLTTLVGFIFLPLSEDMDLFNGFSSTGRLALLFALTVVLELLLLKWFLRSLTWQKTALTSVVMNLLTYAILFLIFRDSV